MTSPWPDPTPSAPITPAVKVPTHHLRNWGLGAIGVLVALGAIGAAIEPKAVTPAAAVAATTASTASTTSATTTSATTTATAPPTTPAPTTVAPTTTTTVAPTTTTEYGYEPITQDTEIIEGLGTVGEHLAAIGDRVAAAKAAGYSTRSVQRVTDACQDASDYTSALFTVAQGYEGANGGPIAEGVQTTLAYFGLGFIECVGGDYTSAASSFELGVESANDTTALLNAILN